MVSFAVSFPCLHGVLYLLSDMDNCFHPLQKVVYGKQAFMGIDYEWVQDLMVPMHLGLN